MIKLKVVFSIDPTGHEKDITEEVLIPSDVCLFCFHDLRLNINRLENEIAKVLSYKGYKFDSCYFFYLLKVYSV